MMEFATENYLSDLLINAENKGFESAKESFYECIANDQSAVEGIVREDGTTTGDESKNNSNETTQKSGFFQKLIDLIKKFLEFAWKILTFIPKWIYNKIVDLGAKYKTMNLSSDKIKELPQESIKAIDDYLVASHKSFNTTVNGISSILSGNYMKNLNQIIIKGENISSNDASDGIKIADEATAKINDVVKKCEDEFAALNEIKSKINLGDSSISSVDIAAGYRQSMLGNKMNANLYSQCKRCCNEGAATAKSLSSAVEKLSNSKNPNDIASFLSKVSLASKSYLNMTKIWQKLITQHYSLCFSGLLKITNPDTAETKYHSGVIS